MARLISFKNSTEYVVVGGTAQVSWSIQGLAICFLIVGRKISWIRKSHAATVVVGQKNLKIRIIVLGLFSLTKRSLNIRASSLGPCSKTHARMKPLSINTKGLDTNPVSIKTKISNRINNTTLKVPQAPDNY